MLNNGGATAVAFPDVCVTPVPTPAGPVPTPLPYPNLASTAMTNPETLSETVLVVALPSLNQGSEIPMTEGDEMGVEGGVMSGEFAQVARFPVGSTCVMVDGLPAVRLGSPTTHNGMLPNAQGVVATPSQTVVIIRR
ncbi:DUF4150 domain-containing protein [Pandoraea iniqua]|nr:DUF4150 domain-containing protein [Pandoraea iniqua]